MALSHLSFLKYLGRGTDQGRERALALVLSIIHAVLMSHPLQEGFPDSFVRQEFFGTHSMPGYYLLGAKDTTESKTGGPILRDLSLLGGNSST